jgi:DNA polymerase
VLTNRGGIEEKAIEYVELTDMVWDGVEWVNHNGVQFQGEKEVIFYDNICATPEHVVYLEDGISVRLEEAKKRGLAIWEGNPIPT